MDKAQFDRELEELGDRFTLGYWRDTSRQPSWEEWCAVLPEHTPAQIYDRLACLPEKHIRITVELKDPTSQEETPAIFFATRQYADDSQDALEAEVEFSLLANREAWLYDTEIHSEGQGNHLAKHYLKASVDLMQELGAESVNMTSVIIGGYAWAKYGFLPKDESAWDSLRENIKKRLADDDTVHFRGWIKPYVQCDEHYDVALERAVIDRILDADFEDLPEVFPQLTELNRELDEYGGRPLTVGKALLLFQGWEGKLPLDEQSPAFQRFQNYVGSAPERDLERA